jgi:hypothetical protein
MRITALLEILRHRHKITLFAPKAVGAMIAEQVPGIALARRNGRVQIGASLFRNA